jgi:hypothetical protein
MGSRAAPFDRRNREIKGRRRGAGIGTQRAKPRGSAAHSGSVEQTCYVDERCKSRNGHENRAPCNPFHGRVLADAPELRKLFTQDYGFSGLEENAWCLGPTELRNAVGLEFGFG